MKEFLMLIREDANYGDLSMEEMQECVEKHIQWVNGLIEKDQFREANPLDAGGAYIRGKEKIVTDGPYIESKECISGYYILKASSLEDALNIAKTCPDLEYDRRTVEIREITQLEE
ncbi:YciI family protein [Arcticibacter sp.]|jgi:hypothetical protein|uniref:YciI family protein n=1 Tax=Arcticibacter sp. TaxID=1872630 RepID=UPI00388FCF77